MRGLAAAIAVSAGVHVAVVAALGADAAGRNGVSTPGRPLQARIAPHIAELTDVTAQKAEHMRKPSEGAPDAMPGAASSGSSQSVAASPATGPLAVPLAGVRYYRARELERRPEALNEVEIAYPEEAVRARMQGMMRLELFISDTGRLDKAVILDADPPGVFDQAVIDAVRALEFSPGVLGGRNVRSVKLIEIPLNAAGDSATLQSAQAPVLTIHINQK
jgi:protein TonB